MKEVKKIVFTKDFWYDDEMFVEAGEYDFVPANGCGYDEVLINNEWFDFCDIEALDYYIREEN